MSKMMIGKTRTGSSTAALGFGIGFTILITLLLSAGLTSLIITGKLHEISLEIFTAIIRAVAVFSGCMITTAIKKEKILQNIGIVTAVYVLVLLGLGIILYDHSFHSFGFGILSVLLGSVAAFLIRLRPNKQKHIKRHIR